MKSDWLLTAAAFAALTVGAAESATSTTATTAERTTEVRTTTVVTKTVVRERTQWSPFRVCVLDFTTIDIKGQKRFLDDRNRPIVIPPQCTLTDADRRSIDSVMQGYVRLIDAADSVATNDANRDAQIGDNRFDRAKALALYRQVVKGESRPVVIGADYLAAYLGRHNDVFGCTDRGQMLAAMDKLQSTDPEFPRDFMLKLARETGATHLVSATVSDLRSRSNSFEGYGIRTRTTTYQLDVIVKLVDLVAQRTVYSNVYTGSYREQRPVSTEQLDHNIFQNLMTAALEQAAEDLYEVCKPGPRNRVRVTPLPPAAK